MFIYIDFRAKRGKFRVKAEMHVHIYRFDEKLIEIKGRFENYVHITIFFKYIYPAGQKREVDFVPKTRPNF